VSGEGASAVETMFEEGRRAWADVALERRVFEAFVEERVPPEGNASGLHAADLYLACACALGDARALAGFEKRYLCEVPAFLARTSADRRFIDDVKQQVRERLFVEGKIRHYSGRGPLGTWLRVVTVRAAANMRATGEKPHSELDDAIPSLAISPELAAIRGRHRDEFRAAFRDALADLTAEDRCLLRLHYLEGLNIATIGAALRLSRATIGRRVVALRQRIIADVNRLLRQRLHATPTELDSLLRVVRSDLALSISTELREPEPR
jgi:RNA polymerase sigma-70 factor (ECF subfamily)